MARLEAKLKGQFYPTASWIVKEIRGWLEKNGVSNLIAFDPCMGDGAFLELAPQVSEFWGVEIQPELVERARKKARNLRHYFITADFFKTTISNNFAGLLFLNPPYDSIEGDRAEIAFIKRSWDKLANGGLAIFILSESFFSEAVFELPQKPIGCVRVKDPDTPVPQVIAFLIKGYDGDGKFYLDIQDIPLPVEINPGVRPKIFNPGTWHLEDIKRWFPSSGFYQVWNEKKVKLEAPLDIKLGHKILCLLSGYVHTENEKMMAVGKIVRDKEYYTEVRDGNKYEVERTKYRFVIRVLDKEKRILQEVE